MKTFRPTTHPTFGYPMMTENPDGEWVRKEDVAWKRNGPELDYLRDGRVVLLKHKKYIKSAVWVSKLRLWRMEYNHTIKDDNVTHIIEIPEVEE